MNETVQRADMKRAGAVGRGRAAARLAIAWCLAGWCGSVVAGGDWPMFRGNPALTGVAEGALPDKPKLLWRFKAGGGVKSSPAIAGGRSG